MYLDSENNSIVVKEVFKASPAEKAGILPEDEIIKVAGKNVSGNDYAYVREMITAAKEKGVEVSVYRPSEETHYEFNLKVENCLSNSNL